ncbi:hypothetical protein PEC18_08170 [Paucibacter sp. O1-1]|nr:hypothetical protein [Paucibacter sp. O1-1]MDA3825843.1 hypothetical protein [Paucibacter sp. O1-1]
MASDGFEPEDLDALLNDFSARLRERDKPIDLTISLARLEAAQRPALPPAGGPRRPGAGRWNMDDVSDVEDLSERRRALQARAEQQAAERAAAERAAAERAAAERAAAERAAAERAAAIEVRRRAAAAESATQPRIALARAPDPAVLDLASIRLPEVAAPGAASVPSLSLPAAAPQAALDLSSLGRMLGRVAHQAAAHAAQSRVGAETDAGSSPAPLLKT